MPELPAHRRYIRIGAAKIASAFRFLDSLVRRFPWYSILADYFLPKEKVKLRIVFKNIECVLQIRYYYQHSSQAHIEENDRAELPLLLRSGGLFALLSGPRLKGLDEIEGHLEEGTLGLRFELFSRLSELKREARSESAPFSEQSERDLFKFLLLNPDIARPYLFLLENGNLRLLWKNKQGGQVGLQFRGGENVQYVIFARTTGSESISRSAGRDLLSNVQGLIDAHDVGRLISARA